MLACSCPCQCLPELCHAVLSQRKTVGLVGAMTSCFLSFCLFSCQIDHVRAERDVLAEVHNPYVVKLYYSFQVSAFFDTTCCSAPNWLNINSFKQDFSDGLCKFTGKWLCSRSFLYGYDLHAKQLCASHTTFQVTAHTTFQVTVVLPEHMLLFLADRH